jgi:CO/xanthine dehydrogenase FAD-binding subunit
MLKGLTDYTYAMSLKDAWETRLAHPRSLFLSGGVGIGIRKESATERIIDLRKALNSNYEETKHGIRIGAGISINEWLEQSDDPLVIEALRKVGTNQIRNMATIGGSIAQHFSWSDVCTLLLAIDGEVTVFSGASTQIKIDAYWGKKDPGIIEQVWIPRWHTHGQYFKFAQTGYDISYLNMAIAARIENGQILKIGIAVGARPGSAMRMSKLERFLEQNAPYAAIAEQTEQITGIASEFPLSSNHDASADYRRTLVITSIQRFLERLQP